MKLDCWDELHLRWRLPDNSPTKLKIMDHFFHSMEIMFAPRMIVLEVIEEI